MNEYDTTSEDLDRLQRAGPLPPVPEAGSCFTEAPADLRVVMRVRGVGCTNKAQAASSATRDLLVSLYGYQVPLAFIITSEPGQISIRVGTWLPAQAIPSDVKDNGRLVETGLRSLYPAINLQADEPSAGSWPLGGIVMGVPTPDPPSVATGERQLDRLLRALSDVRWGALVLAQPVGEPLIRDLKLKLINEMRSVQTSARLGGVPSPLADHYSELLGVQLRAFTDAQGTGAWRTAVYLYGDNDGYPHAASLWRGVFSGEHSLPEPVRVWDHVDAPMFAEAWSMPDPVPDLSERRYCPPFQHQTLLSSAQLAAYVAFPTVETNGFTVTEVPSFDSVPPPSTSGSLVLGTLVERQRVTATPYGLDPDKLTRHAFVTGVTGSGKTNTVFNLLRALDARDVPFLILEPAKTEYRALLHDPGLGRRLQVLTPGNETVAPLRLNPFEVPRDIPLAVHLDLLRSVFNASFGMWTPLPQILEVCLHDIYTDHGWDVTTDTNRRIDGNDRSSAFPTLTDLVAKVEYVVPRLGYEDKVTGDMKAALSTRLNSLRTAGKGHMLDTRSSIPVEQLFTRPTVLELEGMGDDDDKAFVMGLLMIRLAEYRRTQGDAAGLRHLLVVEEAHRLLANTSPGRGGEGGEADARGKAIETFMHLLSEVRAYGQGVVIVDQIPTKLAPDVLKNTNLKIAHRIVAGDDREALGAAMAMTQHQTVAFATMPVGRAAVFTDGEDAPLLLQIPLGKGGTATWPTHQEVREHMSQTGPDTAGPLLPTSDCDLRCLRAPEACQTARSLLQEPVMRRCLGRLIYSAVQTQDALTRVWPDVLATIEPRRPRHIDSQDFFRCFARHGARRIADDRGARSGWTYADTAAVADLIDQTVLNHLDDRDTNDDTGRLRMLLLTLQGGHGPFQACPRIWENRPGPCLCRLPVAELVDTGAHTQPWREARDTDRASPDGGHPNLWNVCQDAAYHLVEFPVDGQPTALTARLKDIVDCTALCFAQHMLAAEKWAHPATERRILNALLTEAGGRTTHSEEENPDA
ncbi:ATP-binding protein [Streptomyces lateritius]|uniref:ATP-binding protein n=1 Tax=Streptomyces lateritius TaxID=67313 RepID=UPI0016787931|nr:DUF87 domain-containing protein [Streptomyces lateritius]GGU16918.1 hypothetical protein GCM10010272_71500 [Streptomyces lateritius]